MPVLPMLNPIALFYLQRTPFWKNTYSGLQTHSTFPGSQCSSWVVISLTVLKSILSSVSRPKLKFTINRVLWPFLWNQTNAFLGFYSNRNIKTQYMLIKRKKKNCNFLLVKLLRKSKDVHVCTYAQKESQRSCKLFHIS